MTKKELQEKLTELEIPFKQKDTVAILEDLLANAVIIDPNAITTTAEDDITPMVIDGVTNPVQTTDEVEVEVKTDSKVVFISPVVFNGKKYEFSTQDSKRYPIDTFECDSTDEANEKIAEIIKGL